MNTKKIILYLLLVGAFLDFSCLCAQDMTTVYPSEYTDPFANPLMGFRTDDRDKYGLLDRQYIRWNDIENDESDGIDKIIDYCNSRWAGYEDKNIKVIPRVYLNWDDETGNEYWPADMTTGDYTSDQFKLRLRRLIRRLGQVWDNDPRVAWIETGIIGKWGEQHSPQPTSEVQQLMGEEFTAAFPNKKLLTRRPWEYFTDWEWGGYWDAWSNWGQINSHGVQIDKLNKEQDRWKSTIWEGEVAYNCCEHEIQPGDNPDLTLTDSNHLDYIINSIRTFHCSALGWIDSYNKNDPDVAVGAKEVQKAFGYKFVINEFTSPGRTEPGGILDFSFKVKNTGSAPFYERWTLAFVLIDPATNEIVYYEELPNYDVREWMPGTDYDWDWETGSGSRTYLIPAEEYEINASVSVPGDIAVGQYMAGVSILEPYSRTPGIFFANENFVKESQTQPFMNIGVGEDLNGSPEIDSSIFDDLNADDNRHYSLEWNGETYSLSMSVMTGGTVSSASGDYPDSRNVYLKAEAEVGYVFSGWSGDLSGTENPVIITMDSDKNITANFVKVATFTLKTNSTNGTIILNPAGGTYNTGTVVTIEVIPELGYKFTGWSGDLSGTENPTTITMDSDKSITASFQETPVHTLTTSAEGGTIKLDPAGPQYNEGTVVKVEAMANPGFFFLQWSGDPLNFQSWINPNFISMNSDKNITAEFMQDPNADNLIKNGDFSIGINSWTPQSISPAQATISVVNKECKIEINSVSSEEWHVNILQPGIKLESNVNYSLTFDARANADKTISAQAQFDHDPWTNTLAENINITTTMESYSVNWLQEKEATTYKVGFFFGSDTTNVWIDNVKLLSNVTSVKQEENINPPENIRIMQNYPNPFNPTTTINYQLSKNDIVSLIIYNVMGELVKTLVQGEKPAGYHQVQWDGKDENNKSVATGMYIYLLKTNNYVESRKMILLK